jgi:hypothetical protein
VATLIMTLSLAATLFALPTAIAHETAWMSQHGHIFQLHPTPSAWARLSLIVFWINQVPATSQGWAATGGVT